MHINRLNRYPHFYWFYPHFKQFVEYEKDYYFYRHFTNYCKLKRYSFIITYNILKS
jgi:hypothetical protein